MKLYMDGKLIFKNIDLADTFYERFKGLMLRKNLDGSDGLLLKNCSSVHCFLMRFSIDVIYLSNSFEIVGKETIKPWRVGHFYKGARHVLEVAEGKAHGLEVGKFLNIEN